MKTVLSTLCALALVFTACGKKKDTPSKPGTDSTAQKETPPKSATDSLSQQLDSILKSTDSMMKSANQQLDSALKEVDKSLPTATSPKLLVTGDELRTKMQSLSWKQQGASGGETKYRGELDFKGMHTAVTTNERGSNLYYVRATIGTPLPAAAEPTFEGLADLVAGSEAAAWVKSAVGGKDAIKDIGSYHMVYSGGSQQMLTITAR